jgi:hypothetical protein
VPERFYLAEALAELAAKENKKDILIDELKRFAKEHPHSSAYGTQLTLWVPYAPEGQKIIAGGKRSAAPGRYGLNKSPGRGERIMSQYLSPLPGL